MKFGSYTLYSCYGTTANGNTFPIAFGVIFGNECKEGWITFFECLKRIHPALNVSQNTIISDQDKGLKESIKSVMDEVGHFFCMWHREQNIYKVCKGGNHTYSGAWLFRKLVHAKTMASLEKIKLDSAPHMSTNVLNYLNKVEDSEQYPVARCDQGDDIYMNDRKASSSGEAMNKANANMRARTAVDPVNSVLLLINLQAGRHERLSALAHSCKDILTPLGTKLMQYTFRGPNDPTAGGVDYRKYQINYTDDSVGDRVLCVVTYIGDTGKPHLERKCYFPNVAIMGSKFGGCSCGEQKVLGRPCHHMVAVVKSGRILNLDKVNEMPYWFMSGNFLCGMCVNFRFLRLTDQNCHFFFPQLVNGCFYCLCHEQNCGANSIALI